MEDDGSPDDPDLSSGKLDGLHLKDPEGQEEDHGYDRGRNLKISVVKHNGCHDNAEDDRRQHFQIFEPVGKIVDRNKGGILAILGSSQKKEHQLRCKALIDY